MGVEFFTPAQVVSASPGLEPQNSFASEKGFLYVGVGLKYVKEAEISARSLKRFTKYPICLYTDQTEYSNPNFDIIIHAKQKNLTYANKIDGTIASPFYKTVFLDGDTFICSSIDNLFDILEVFDMSMMPAPIVHSYGFWQQTNPRYKIPYEGIVPEYHTAVMVFKKNEQVMNLLGEWLRVHSELKCGSDMPSFREAYLKYIGKVTINPLPNEYDFNGTMTFGILYHEVKIIHEKIAEEWNNLRLVMASFEKMEKHAKLLNKHKEVKRVVVPYVGPIPYYLSPFNIKRKIKRLLGIRYKSKLKSMPKESPVSSDPPVMAN